LPMGGFCGVSVDGMHVRGWRIMEVKYTLVGESYLGDFLDISNVLEQLRFADLGNPELHERRKSKK
jgi:hypothetical protein